MEIKALGVSISLDSSELNWLISELVELYTYKLQDKEYKGNSLPLYRLESLIRSLDKMAGGLECVKQLDRTVSANK